MTGSCPKHMVLGPCGGVRADGGCEVVSDPCVFPVPAQWAGSSVPPVPLQAVPLILTDFSSEPYSVRLAALAASIGISAAVPETPAAPPRRLRAFRLAQKQLAGAAVAVLNHDTVASVTRFMADAERAGVTIPVIASVSVFTDEPSAAVLSGLPGLELDPDVVRRVLADPDPVAAGIAAAAREASALLGIPGVAGVNISGAASARGYEFAAKVKAELAARIREERDHDR